MNRIKNWLPILSPEERRLQQLKQSVEGKPKKRKPFQAKVTLPWYSLNRFRNLVIIAVSGVVWMNWDVGRHVGRSIKHGYRLEQERKKFIAELDEEDRRLEALD